MAPTASELQAVTIRPVESADAAAVAELCGQLGYPVTQQETNERINWLQKRGDAQIALIASSGQHVVGWIEAAVEHRLQSPPFALITGLVVRDEARGLGVGRKLCEAVERWSRERGLNIVRVTSRSTRDAAHRFYLRDGYKQIKTSAVFEKILS